MHYSIGDVLAKWTKLPKVRTSYIKGIRFLLRVLSVSILRLVCIELFHNFFIVIMSDILPTGGPRPQRNRRKLIR